MARDGTAEHDQVDPAGFATVATYLGNTFQAMNQLSNLIIYDLLTGVALITAALIGLSTSVMVIGDARFEVALPASYARHNARSPFYSQALCTAIALAGMLVAFMLQPGAAALLALGLAVSAYVALQRLWRSPELRITLLGAVRADGIQVRGGAC